MIQSFFIEGKLPGLNDLLDAKAYRSTQRDRKMKRWNGYANLKRTYGEMIYWTILKTGLAPMKQVRFRFNWVEADRRRDPDNVVSGGRKIILDALVKAKILEDDGWKQVMSWQDFWVVDASKPGVLVTMESID